MLTAITPNPDFEKAMNTLPNHLTLPLKIPILYVIKELLSLFVSLLGMYPKIREGFAF